MRLGPYLRLLARNRDFRRLYAAQLISFGGDWFATVALLGLTLELTGSSSSASLVLVLQVLPFFLASPIAGVLADRVDRRRLMVTADLVRVAVALGFLLARDASTLWIAFVAVALLSGVSAFFEPTSSAALPNLVDDEDLPAANVLIGAAWGTMLAVGAALGGVVAVAFGRDAAFLLNAASFLASGLLILRIHRPFSLARPPGAPAPAALVGVRGSVAQTLRLARGSRKIAALLLSKATFGVGSGVILLLAIFATAVFQAGDAGIGLLFAARGVGALLGPFLARSVTGLDDRGLIRGIGLSLVGFLVCYGLFPLAPTLWLAALCVLGAHLGGGAQWTLSSYGLQRTVPDAIRGRVFSFDYGMGLLVSGLSILATGALSGWLGPHAAIYLLLGVASVASVGWLLFTRPLRRQALVGEAPYPTSR